MEHNDFANVSWQNDPAAHGRASTTLSPRGEAEEAGSGNPNAPFERHGSGGQLGRNADALDLAGVGEGTLDCTVTSPIKENDGSKDAYVSYLVTTNVGLPLIK
jgi:sorting nexin-4